MNYNWENITKEELEELYYNQSYSDVSIAELYGVTSGKVRYKRQKWNINYRNRTILEFQNRESELYKILNAGSRERMLNYKDFDVLSKVLTHYVFRNGPIEDMHANGQLSENDMKTLNKYMVNRFAGLFKAIEQGRWVEIETLFSYYKAFGIDWDTAEPDTREFDISFDALIRKLAKER